MSVEPGQYGAYTPPPPPAARRSPWLWVALGCGGAVLLGFVGCGTLVGVVGNRLKNEMAKPLDVAAVKKGLKDTPVYPGATIDEKNTKVFRATISMTKGMGGDVGKTMNSMEIAAYKTPDSEEKILAWYDKALAQAGYKKQSAQQNPVSGAEQRSYVHGKEVVIVQIPQKNTGASFVLTRATEGGKGASSAPDAEPATK